MSILRWKQCEKENVYYVKVATEYNEWIVVEQVDAEKANEVFEKIVEELEDRENNSLFMMFDSDDYPCKELAVRKSSVVNVVLRNVEDD